VHDAAPMSCGMTLLRGSAIQQRRDANGPELIGLIRQRHLEHEARLAMSGAIGGAEVAVLGADGATAERLAARVRVCGGMLVHEVRGTTRFAVSGPLATPEQLASVAARGVTVLSEHDLDAMINVYASLTCHEELRAAARRAREEAARRATLPMTVQRTPAHGERPWGGFHSGVARAAVREPALGDEEPALGGPRRARSGDAAATAARR